MFLQWSLAAGHRSARTARYLHLAAAPTHRRPTSYAPHLCAPTSCSYQSPPRCVDDVGCITTALLLTRTSLAGSYVLGSAPEPPDTIFTGVSTRPGGYPCAVVRFHGDRLHTGITSSSPIIGVRLRSTFYSFRGIGQSIRASPGTCWHCQRSMTVQLVPLLRRVQVCIFRRSVHARTLFPVPAGRNSCRLTLFVPPADFS